MKNVIIEVELKFLTAGEDDPHAIKHDTVELIEDTGLTVAEARISGNS